MALRSNGSTMKPLLVYAPAFELGTLSPGSILPDVPLKLNPASNKPWPSNYGGGYHGLVTARQALAKSYNIPAVKAYVDILDKRPADYLTKMGITSLTEGDYSNRSAALGGLTKGISVEENTNAFGTFANNGQFIDAYMIDKITDKEGKIIYQHEIKPVDVFSPQTAYLTYDMLRDVINGGTATSVKNRLKFSSDWAGKTGTSQDYKDTWFVATNPNVSFGVWNGYDEPKTMGSNKGLTYSLQNIYLWAALMNSAYDVAPELVDPSESLPRPEGIVSRSFCAITGQLPSDACAQAGLVRTDLFNAKFLPNKTDNSLISGRFVTIGNKNYMALDTTPAEFTETGLILNPDAMKRMFSVSANASQYLPKNSSLGNALVPNAKMAENGKTPASPAITVSGSKISWGNHPESDIIGYRVYSGGKKVASIKAGGSLSYSGGNGSYYVTAVDIAGKESAPSNTASVGQPAEVSVDAPPEKPDQKVDQAPVKTEEVPATPVEPISPPANSQKPPTPATNPEKAE